MFSIRMADLNVKIDNRYDLILGKCQSYLVSNSVQPDFTLRIPEEEIRRIQQFFLENERLSISEAEAESDGTHYLMYPELPRFQAFWIHACAIALDGWGYVFSAPPGTGKTTHALAWLKEFPERARIINGDNPIIRKKDGVFTVYGTPFSGKEGLNENRCVPVKGLCFLRRAETNRIKSVAPATAMMRMYWDNWCIPRQDEACVQSHLDIFNEFVNQVPVYVLSMNNFLPDVVKVAYEGMQGGK